MYCVSVRCRTHHPRLGVLPWRMCFSMTASFTSATLLLAVGGVASQHVRAKVEWPYALIPVMFGMQQILEGLIWIALGDGGSSIGRFAPALTQGYSLFSQVLWPVYIPVAVWMLEPRPRQRTMLMGISAAGALVSLFLLNAMVENPVTAHLQENHIAYAFAHVHIVSASLLYLLGTCVAPLLSSHTSVRLFGVAAFSSALLAYIAFSTWFISVWCFFAGALSCVVLLYFIPFRRFRPFRTQAHR